jgi:hypothetical protein
MHVRLSSQPPRSPWDGLSRGHRRGEHGHATPVGSVLKVGKPAIVPTRRREAEDQGHDPDHARVDRQGSMATSRTSLDAAQKTATPYYRRCSRRTSARPSCGTRPDLYLNGVDDRGQSQSSIIFFGDFARCSEGGAEGHRLASRTRRVRRSDRQGRRNGGAVWSEYDPKHPDKTNINWKR